tara:strand:+ start:214 stop:420 length:207 start_codon:yes stop_codon:yes gene_type:complete
MKKLLNGKLVDMTEQEIEIRNSDIEKTKTLIKEEKALYDAEQAKKASGKQKLKDLGLDDDEIKALTGA